MRLLLDINILLDVAFQRPGEPATAQVIARCGREHEVWLAWHSVAILACLIIITRHVRDFKGSPVPAMTPEVFTRQHMPPSVLKPKPAPARRRKPRAI